MSTTFLFRYRAIWRKMSLFWFSKNWTLFKKQICSYFIGISKECCKQEKFWKVIVPELTIRHSHTPFSVGAELSECALRLWAVPAGCCHHSNLKFWKKQRSRVIPLPVDSLLTFVIPSVLVLQSWRPTCKAPTSWTSSRRKWGRPRRSVRSSRRRPKTCKENSEWKSIVEKM